MKILFMSRLNPYDINEWSGTVYYIYNKLKQTHDIQWFGGEIIPQISTFLYGNFSRKNKSPIEDYCEVVGKLLSERIRNIQCDLIFFGDNFFLPYLYVDIPIVRLSDTTYQQYRVYLDVKDNEQINLNLERLSLRNNTAYILSSEWAKQGLVNYYGIQLEKINVIEFGANISIPSIINFDIEKNECKLVFIGRNWKKKGGDKVLDAYRILKTQGFPCHLTIIGSEPTEPIEEDLSLTIIPFLDKSKSADIIQFNEILLESHFLVLPTEFDCFGIVFCEASAYGVPSIASDVGGVSQVIREGKNGFLLPPHATARDYADKIRNVFEDTEQYKQLRKSSRKEFEERLNWDVWGEKVNKILEEVVTSKKSTSKAINKC